MSTLGRHCLLSYRQDYEVTEGLNAIEGLVKPAGRLEKPFLFFFTLFSRAFSFIFQSNCSAYVEIHPVTCPRRPSNRFVVKFPLCVSSRLTVGETGCICGAAACETLMSVLAHTRVERFTAFSVAARCFGH